jgi:hypothetical protein
MAVTADIPGLNEGVGLVPQGRLGSGIANVFDTSNVAANLARLGARMENLEKLKLATAAKLASAKQKEAVAKAPKYNSFEFPAVTGKSAFRSGNRVMQNLQNEGLNLYMQKRAANDVDGANQVIPLYKFTGDSVNNKTASIESEIENWWTKGAGKFYLPNPVVENNIEANRPDKVKSYLEYDETPVRSEQYLKQTGTYNFDAVGQWAKENSGRTSFSKTFSNGVSTSASGISALYELPINKEGKVIADAPLQVDYNVAENFFASNPDIRSQMITSGKSEAEKILDSDEYKKATTDEQRKEITDKAFDTGVKMYIDRSLQGRADKDIKNDLESTYRRAMATKKAEGKAEKNYRYSVSNYNTGGKIYASSISDPKKRSQFNVDYDFGAVPQYNFSKDPQEITSQTYVVPLGNPRVLIDLGVMERTVNPATGEDKYTLKQNVKFGSATYVNNAYVNKTPNRGIAAAGSKTNTHIIPTGILLPKGYTPSSQDQPTDGFIVNALTGPLGRQVTKREMDMLIQKGYTINEINAGLEMPFLVDRTQSSGAALNTFIEDEFPNTLPKSSLQSNKY